MVGVRGSGPFPMQTTESVTLSAAETSYFAQPVFVSVHWKLADARHQPAGQYIGRVQLCGLVMPE